MSPRVQKRFEAVIRFLAEQGARVDMANQLGDTPLAVALRPLPPPPGALVLVSGMPQDDDGGPRIAEVLRSLGATQ